MIPERALYRLHDIKQAIGDIRTILSGLTFEGMYDDIRTRAAFERFLEIISEASRRIPEEWRQQHGADLPWPDIAAVGNILRHVYRDVDHRVLWNIYEHDLSRLEVAINAMLTTYDPTGETTQPPHP